MHINCLNYSDSYLFYLFHSICNLYGIWLHFSHLNSSGLHYARGSILLDWCLVPCIHWPCLQALQAWQVWREAHRRMVALVKMSGSWPVPEKLGLLGNDPHRQLQVQETPCASIHLEVLGDICGARQISRLKQQMTGGSETQRRHPPIQWHFWMLPPTVLVACVLFPERIFASEQVKMMNAFQVCSQVTVVWKASHSVA